MKASTARALHREAMARRRIKEHTAAWWHKQHCPACAAGMPHGHGQGLAAAIQAAVNGMPDTEDLPHGTVVPIKRTLN